MVQQSSQDKLPRKPRVHITYKVETEGAEVIKELPFVTGVIGDFSGNPSGRLPPLKDRKFVQIDRDNFDQVMQRLQPELNFRVDNILADGDSQIAVKLKFDSMRDFEPAQIARQVEPLKNLLEIRDRLRDLAAKIDRSPELEQLLEEVLSTPEDLQRLKSELDQN